MEKHSLKVLEFDRICEFLNTFATSSGGKEGAENWFRLMMKEV